MKLKEDLKEYKKPARADLSLLDPVRELERMCELERRKEVKTMLNELEDLENLESTDPEEKQKKLEADQQQADQVLEDLGFEIEKFNTILKGE